MGINITVRTYDIELDDKWWAKYGARCHNFAGRMEGIGHPYKDINYTKAYWLMICLIKLGIIDVNRKT